MKIYYSENESKDFERNLNRTTNNLNYLIGNKFLFKIFWIHFPAISTIKFKSSIKFGRNQQKGNEMIISLFIISYSFNKLIQFGIPGGYQLF